MCSCRNEALELWERRFPVLFTCLRLSPDSGGAGRFRGGLGYRRELELLADVRLNAFQDRHQHGAPGIFGGEPGAPNALLFRVDGVWGDAREHFGSPSTSKLTNLRLPAGSAIAILAGGGGGWGDPAARAREAIERDLEHGYVTEWRR
jgi:N-methylhydantoinase B